MPMVTITAYSNSISDSESITKDVPVSLVDENFWSAQYSLIIRTSPEGADRIEVTCCFCAEEAYFLGPDREIIPLSD